MEAIPRNYDECRFDAFCKSVLRNEAHNYRRGLKRQRDRQVSISTLSQADMDMLCTRTLYDEYGYPYICLDEWMKHHLENKLIQAIVGLG